MQGYLIMQNNNPLSYEKFKEITDKIKKENIPSLNAGINKLKTTLVL